MSNRQGRRCMRGLLTMWTNVKSLFSRIFSHSSRRRRRSRSSENNVTLVHVSRMSDTEASRDWAVDPMIHVNNRAPPRKRYHHDRSPDTLMQIKIALQEQVVKDIICEEIHKNVIKPEMEMESGERISDREIDDKNTLTKEEEY
ncbi:hypothetical protein O3M35_012646 [Rhynocoris fuscipes]|uniref:Uncharacterized protein n=1 Tax=Rhynocoris fuscipes TaxID=488301 RepID=A0AAW1CTU1_9HEMI